MRTAFTRIILNVCEKETIPPLEVKVIKVEATTLLQDSKFTDGRNYVNSRQTSCIETPSSGMEIQSAGCRIETNNSHSRTGNLESPIGRMSMKAHREHANSTERVQASCAEFVCPPRDRVGFIQFNMV